MTSKKRGRLSRRERIEAVNRGLRAWGVMYGKPEVAEALQQQLPKQRTPRMRGVDIDRVHRKPLERDVLKAIVQRLRLDPRVARVERNQSGVFQDGNRYIRVGVRGKLDLTVYLKSGAYLELEVKRPGGKPEPHQQKRIDDIRASGGLAGYATSPEEAIKLLP